MKAGRELDTIIAEKVMGYKRLIGYNGWKKPTFHPQANSVVDSDRLPNYSTDIAAAWEVVEKIHHTHEGCDIGIIFDRNSKFTAVINFPHLELQTKSSGETAPHAICLAALAALNQPQE